MGRRGEGGVANSFATPARVWGAGAVLLSALVALALPGSALEHRLGVGTAEAGPKLIQRVFNQDRTILPQHSVSTKLFCPGRFIPFTWGYRSISLPPAGVSVNAFLTSVVPEQKGTKKAGFAVTLFNPNVGPTIRMRVSTTCVMAKEGLLLALGRGGSVAGKPKPKLTLDTEKKKLKIPAGRRVAKKVFCDGKRDTAVADIGYRSGQSELVGYLPVTKKGVPGADIVVQNRTAVDDKGKAFVNCLEGKRFKIKDQVSQPTNQQAQAAAAGDRVELPGAGSAARKPGLLIDRVEFTGNVAQGVQSPFTGACGQPKPVPKINAVGAGGAFLIGPRTGPALDQFLRDRQALILNEPPAPRGATGAAFSGTFLEQFRFDLLNLDPATAAVKQLMACTTGLGGVKTLVHSKSDVEQ